MYPIKPTYAWDDSLSIGGAGTYITGVEGFCLYKSNISDKIHDIKTNRDTMITLVSASDTTDVLVDKNDISGLYGKYVVLMAPSGDALTTTAVSALSYGFRVNSQDKLFISNANSNGSKLLSFTLTTSGSDIKINYHEKATSVAPAGSDGRGGLELSWEPDVSACTFTATPAGTSGWYTLSVSGTPVVYNYGGYGTNATTPLTAFKYFAFSKNGTSIEPLSQLSANGLDAHNKWLQYKNIYTPDYAVAYADLTPADAYTISGIKVNHLLTAPYAGLSISGTHGTTLAHNIIPTKNFKSINSDQMIIPSLVSAPSSVAYRDYRRIYTGGNQIAGYPKIHVGYNSEYGTIIELASDAETYFHIPTIAEEQDLSATNLQSAGAVAGSVPAYSDRIYQKLGDYSSHIWWGGGASVNNGTWLCAWLSGNDTNAVWMERYYDPGRMTYSVALSAEGGDIQSSNFIPTTGADAPFTDVPATMKITKGGYYKYFHAGKKSLLKSLNTVYGNDSQHLIFRFTRFDNIVDGVVQDDSGNKNDGTISNPSTAKPVFLDMSPDTNSTPAILFTTAPNDIGISWSPLLELPNERTAMSWIYMNDWGNTNRANQSAYVYSNYYKGGDKLEYINHGMYHSMIIPIATIPGQSRAAIIKSDRVDDPIHVLPTEISGLCTAVDLDGYLWVTGSQYVLNTSSNRSFIYKLAQDGTIMASKQLDGVVIDQIFIVDDNVAYVKGVSNSVSNSVSTMNLHSLDMSTNPGISGTMWFNQGGTTVGYNPDYSQLDAFTDGTTCGVVGTSIYLDNSEMSLPLPSVSATGICCDDDTYAYATYCGDDNQQYMYLIQKSNRAFLGMASTTLSVTGTNTKFNTVFINREMYNNEIRNIIYWVAPNSTMYRFFHDIDKSTVTEISKLVLNTPTIPSVIYCGDCSGYKLNKAHNAIAGSSVRLKYSALLSADTPIKKSVSISVSGLNNTWHHIATTHSSGTAESKLGILIDGILVAHHDIDANNTIVQNTNNMYNIGSGIIGNKTLHGATGSTNSMFLGGYSGISLLSVALPEETISAIFNIIYADTAPIQWPVNAARRAFVEDLDTLYKFKVPGAKSQFYDLVVRGLSLTEDERTAYETLIRTTAIKSSPDHIKLRNVIWK